MKDLVRQIELDERAKLAVALGLEPAASGIAIAFSIATTVIQFIKANPQIVEVIKKLFPKLFPANGDEPVAQ